MLVLYCWLVYGKLPHEALPAEILSKARPVFSVGHSLVDGLPVAE